jgi:hypothetical protein
MLGSAAVNMSVQFSLLYYDIYSFGYLPKIDIAKEDHMLVLILAFLRCLYTDFHSGYTNLQPINSRFPFNLHSLFIIKVFFFFAGQGTVCPGDYVDFSQGWLWEYCMTFICSPVGLRLPSRFETGVEWCSSPPDFSV